MESLVSRCKLQSADRNMLIGHRDGKTRRHRRHQPEVVVTEPTHEEQPKSGVWLALRVFDEPTRVFRELAARPKWVVPVAAFLVAMTIFAFATPTDVLQDLARQQLEAFGVGQGQLTPEQAERIDQAGNMQGRLLVLGPGFVIGIISFVIVAGVLTLIFGALSPEPLKFKHELAIVTHASMANVLGTVVIVVLMVLGLMSQPTLSLGFLFSQDESPFLFNFANQITLFGMWNVFLLSLGNQIKTEAKGIGQALVIVGSLWLLTKLLFAALGAAFS